MDKKALVCSNNDSLLEEIYRLGAVLILWPQLLNKEPDQLMIFIVLDKDLILLTFKLKKWKNILIIFKF